MSTEQRNPPRLCKKPLPPPFIMQQSGWEFSRRQVAERRTDNFLKEIKMTWLGHFYNPIITVKHLQSGFQFCFSGYDALRRWYEELFPGCCPPSSSPSYVSPLMPLGVDSTYVGTTMLEKPGEDPKIFKPEWEDIEFTELGEQIRWTDEFRQVPGIPLKHGFPLPDADGKLESRYCEIPVPEHLKLPEILLTAELLLYDDSFFNDAGTSCCPIAVVVTPRGWFLSLRHVFEEDDRDFKRIREMTMHCNFQNNIVYREISERQHKHLPGKGKDEMCLYFHEIKRLVIEDACSDGSSHIVPNALRHKSFAEKGLNYKFFEAVEISDERVAWLFANCGENMQLLEAETKTYIQIVPCFHHPQPYGQKMREPRKAYIYGSSKDYVDRAKRHLINV